MKSIFDLKTFGMGVYLVGNGYEEESKNGEILWTRIELDNALDNFIMYPSEEWDLTKVTYDEKRLARSGNMQKN